MSALATSGRHRTGRANAAAQTTRRNARGTGAMFVQNGAGSLSLVQLPKGEGIPSNMSDWHTPLAVATGLFLLFMVWRFRPSFSGDGGGAGREGVRKARERLEGAKD